MPPHTHYLAVLGDGHLNGVPQLMLDPYAGQTLEVGASQPIPLNAVLRGGTSGVVARVTGILNPGSSFMLEMIANVVGDHIGGSPGQMWAAAPPFIGETITIDTGGTAVPIPFGTSQVVHTLGGGPLGTRQEASLNSYTPDDPSTDWILYDRKCKVARNIVVPIASVTPVLPTVSFKKGDRVTTSGGGAFTVQLITVVGSDYHFKIIRVTGSVAVGQTLTNTTRTGAGTISVVESDPPIGTWVPHHVLPNLAGLAGTAMFYENIPQGDGGGIGVLGPICRGFWTKWKAAADADDRGVRVVPFKTFDHFNTIVCTGTFPGTWTIGETLNGLGGWQAKLVRFNTTTKVLEVEQQNGYPMAGGTITGATSGATATFLQLGGDQQALMGGVTVQTIVCTGTFPTTWQQGETVQDPTTGFEAKVQGFNATQKRLYVYDTNGIACNAAVVGLSSGASAVASGAAYGWQKGSRYWNHLVAHFAEAMSRENALYHGSPAKWEGAILMMWESELSPFSASNGCPWPTVELMRAQWRKLIVDLRTQLAAPEMPVAVWMMDIRSHANDIFIPAGSLGNLPFSFLVREALSQLPATLPKVSLISSDGLQPAQVTPLPYASALLYLRPDDYPELGRRAWRALEFADFQVPAGVNLQPLPIILMIGFSFIVGGIPASWGFLDVDPDLYPSTGFPGVNTLDVNVLNFDTRVDSWAPYDIANNANTWLGSGGFGLEASLSLRAKKRFAEAPATTARIGLLKLAYNGATANGAVKSAPATFDPNGAANVTQSATCTVTVIPANSNNAARGRFTALPGVFSNFEVNAHTIVQGSALGTQGSGGNSSPVYRGGITRVVAADGSYIEVEGTFVPEGPWPFTLTQGPYPLWPEVEKQIRRAFVQAVALGYMPKPVAIVAQLGVVDLDRVDEFEAAYLRLFQRLDAVFGQRHKGEEKIPKIIFEDTPKTPWNAPDQDVVKLITAQRSVAAALENAVTIDTSRLPMESSGIWPRTIRQHHGVHTTPRGYIAMGYMADAALEALGFPAHPEGPAMIEYGSPSGGVLLGASSVPLQQLGPGAAPGDPLDVEDGSGSPTADSYQTVEEADAKADARGGPTEWTSATEAQKNAWLRQAAVAGIDLIFGRLWSGVRKGDVQALDWPRYGAFDSRTRRVVPENAVPNGVKWAQFEFALALAQGIDVLANLNPANQEDRSRFAISTTDRLPGGFEESRTYGQGGPPAVAILTRMYAFVEHLLEDREGVVLA